MDIADLILALLVAYFAVGAMLALWSVFARLHRLDPATAGASWRVRLILLPGLVLLWPLITYWLLTRSSRKGAHP